MKTRTYALLAVAAPSIPGLAAWLWQRGPAVGPPPQLPVADVEAPASQVRATPPAAAEPGVRYPAPAAAASQPLPDLQTGLVQLLGRKAVLSMLQLEDFPRRFVATVDTLGRSHAPASLWPVDPVGGRLVVEQRGGAQSIGADNGSRYTPYLLLFQKVDLRDAVALFRSAPTRRSATRSVASTTAWSK